MIGLAVWLSVIGVFDSLLFAVIEHGLHRTREFFGVLMSAQGAGSIVGGLTAVRLMRRLGAVRAVAVALLLLAASAIPFLAGSVVLVLAGMVCAGAAIPWAFVAMATTRQTLTPDYLQGRTASATGMALQIPQLASTALGAALVAVVDYRLLAAISSVVIVGAGLWLFRRSAASPDTEAQSPVDTQAVTSGGSSPSSGSSAEASSTLPAGSGTGEADMLASTRTPPLL